jgi:predicted amidohydrolase YtcJ
MCNSCGSGIHFLGDHVMKKLNFSSLKNANQEHDQLQPPRKDESKDAETTIFSGDSILTMENGAFSPKDALVMKGETIKFTGSVKDAIEEYGDGATRYDLAGKCLLPGFIDPHVHTTLTSLANNYFLDLSATEVSKLRDAVKIITDALAEGNLKNGWVVGFGYDPSRVINNPDLTKLILDEIPNSQGVPIFVLNQSGHIAYVNSKALEEAGADPETALSGFQRDPKGELTGVILRRRQ